MELVASVAAVKHVVSCSAVDDILSSVSVDLIFLVRALQYCSSCCLIVRIAELAASCCCYSCSEICLLVELCSVFKLEALYLIVCAAELVYYPQAVSLIANKKYHVLSVSCYSDILRLDSLSEYYSVRSAVYSFLVDSIISVAKVKVICIVICVAVHCIVSASAVELVASVAAVEYVVSCSAVDNICIA